MEETVRQATEHDLGRLSTLASEAIAELTPTKGGAVWAKREARPVPVEPSLRAAIAADDHEVIVGSLDDVVLGYGVVRLERLRDGSLLGVVEDLYVDPRARGVSLGEVIMDHLLAWCDAQGCFGVDSIALPGNRETKNFFERFGLVARAIVVHKPLR